MEYFLETSDQIDALFTTIGKIQAEELSVIKSSTNPFHKNKYANLESYLEVLIPICNKVGLIVNQVPVGPYLVTVLTDLKTTQWMRSGYPIITANKTPQEIGAQITYARRYSLSAIFMLSQEPDDDGNTASGIKQLPWLKIPATLEFDKKIVEEFKQKVEKKEITDLASAKKFYQINPAVLPIIQKQYPFIK